MTIRIAIIGTSHVAAIYKAWVKLSAEFPGFEATFFAAPRATFRHFQLGDTGEFGIIDKSLFTPRDIHLMMNTFGKLTIDLSTFDIVLHIGRFNQETNLAQLLNSFSVDGLHEVKGRTRLSRSAYDGFVQALAEKTRLPPAWHNWAEAMLYTVPAPRVSESCTDNDHVDYAPWRTLMPTIASDVLIGALNDYTSRMVSDHSAHGITTILPPQEIYAANGLTREELHRGATDLNRDEPYPDDNSRHMNEQYGEIVLRQVMAAITSDFDSQTTV